MSLPTVAVGVARYRARGASTSEESIRRRVGVPMALGSIVGAMLGARLVGWVDVRLLKAILAIVLSVSSIRMWRHRPTGDTQSRR